MSRFIRWADREGWPWAVLMPGLLLAACALELPA